MEVDHLSSLKYCCQTITTTVMVDNPSAATGVLLLFIELPSRGGIDCDDKK